MGTMATAALLVASSGSSAPAARSRVRCRRVSAEAGRGLEILGHAIEYLADEFVHAGGDLCGRDPRVEAIQLLMAMNRKIYFSCPEVRTLSDWFRAFMRFRPA